MGHLADLRNLVFCDSSLVGRYSSGFSFSQLVDGDTDSEFSLQDVEQE